MYVEYKPGNAKPAYIRRETKLDMQEPQPEKLKSKLSFTLYSMTLFSEHSYFLSYLPYLPSPPHGADQGDLCTMQARKAYGSCDLCHCRLSHFGGDSGHHARHAIWRCWYAESFARYFNLISDALQTSSSLVFLSQIPSQTVPRYRNPIALRSKMESPSPLPSKWYETPGHEALGSPYFSWDTTIPCCTTARRRCSETQKRLASMDSSW